jgi:hypothetical protein
MIEKEEQILKNPLRPHIFYMKVYPQIIKEADDNIQTNSEV